MSWDGNGHTSYVRRTWIICGQGWTMADFENSQMVSLPYIFSCDLTLQLLPSEVVSVSSPFECRLLVWFALASRTLVNKHDVGRGIKGSWALGLAPSCYDWNAEAFIKISLSWPVENERSHEKEHRDLGQHSPPGGRASEVILHLLVTSQPASQIQTYEQFQHRSFQLAQIRRTVLPPHRIVRHRI